MKKIGIADTMFARYDMGALAEKTILEAPDNVGIERYTVPGFKDLPVACKKLFQEHDCDIVMACGMAGGAAIDKQCAHEASLGLQMVQLLTNKHIIEVFVFEDESDSAKELISIFENRTRKHALNALALLKGKDALRPFAGKGVRQGKDDAGPVIG
ncbi:MAG: riboflavin synthase [Nanoarchaeota archaeon]